MNSKVTNLHEDLLSNLTNYQNEVYAIQMKAYMKNRFEFLGIKAPLRKRLLVPYIVECKKLDMDNLKDWIHVCWDNPYRELQYCGMALWQRNLKRMDASEITFAESLILRKPWWDTVDFIASNIVGPLFRKFPNVKNECIERWRADSNMWLRRTCLIFQLKYKSEMDFELIKSLILENIQDKEFFIQKACGWSLRQYSKFDPVSVRSFIDKHPGLSPLARREGMKYLRKSQI